MTTDYPYSQQWRERTLARMRNCSIDRDRLHQETGLDRLYIADALAAGYQVTHEISGPIDELLDRLEEKREAEALADTPRKRRSARSMRVPERGELYPVAVDLNALTNIGTSKEYGRVGRIHLRRRP